jgi:uncharacterized protein involved in exopolysaccharide biosynthesis/Mrp family chromosome partitioning ATPase
MAGKNGGRIVFRIAKKRLAAPFTSQKPCSFTPRVMESRSPESVMSRVETRSQDADIDIGKLFGALWRRKFRILASAIVLTGLAYFVLSNMTPQYSSNARILIESSESVFTRPQSENSQSSDSSLLDKEGVTSQVEILTSSDLLMQVANELNLDENSEFGGTSEMSSLKAGLVALGLVEDPALVSTEKRTLDAIHDRLQVYAVPNSRVIGISFKSSDKELAARFPNALAEAYLALQSRSQLESTGKAVTYLADEIADLQESVSEAEATVAGFRASSDLLLGQNNSSLATQQLAELSTELTRVRAERSNAEARANNIQAALERGASIDTLPDVVQSQLIGRLREREIALNADIADLSTTLLPGHPRIKGLRSQLRDLSRQIRDEARKVLTGIRSEAEFAREREEELMGRLAELKAAAASANEREVKLRALEREAEAQRALLESYLVRYREAASRDEDQYAPAKARLISRAVVPAGPSFPKMIPMLGAAFFVSMIVMMLATLMRELFSGRAFAPAATAARVEPAAEAAGMVASPVPAAGEAAVNEPDAAKAAANDNYGVPALAARLIESGADRAILVSPEGDAGAAASVALTRTMAGEGLRTVLVDLSPDGAASRRMLEDADCPGITDLLSSSSSYSDVIYSDTLTAAHVIPIGIADPERAKRAFDRLPIILDSLISAYDIVVVECGPTDAEALKRVAGTGSRIVLSVVDPKAPEIVETAEKLVDGGFEDLMLVTAAAVGEEPLPPEPRRAYAR